MDNNNNNEFVLMNKDTPVLYFYDELEVIDGEEEYYFEEREWVNPALKPLDYYELGSWLGSRQASKHRQSIAALLEELGCLNLDGFLRTTHALTLNDTFWVKEVGNPVEWKDVSLYTNDFNEVISRIAFEGGLCGINFSTTSPEYGVAGMYKKCWIREDNKIYLIKGGSSGAVNAGLEPFCEGLASQVSKIICPKAVHYDIVKYRGHDACKCELFTDERYGYIPVGGLPNLNRVIDRTIFKYYASLGCGDDYRRMLVLDALIFNVDRHRGNYGFLFDNDTLEIVSAAPIFDNNLSLLTHATDEDLLNIDRYLQNIAPRIDYDFNRAAYRHLTSEIKSDLKNFKGFEFDFSECPNFSDIRKRVLNEQVNKQVDRILGNIRLYVPPSVQTGLNKEYTPFATTRACKQLKDKMSKEALDILCNIIDSSLRGEIDLYMSTDESTIIECRVEVLSSKYKLIGDGSLEARALKWYEFRKREDEDVMINAIENYVKSQHSAEPNQTPDVKKMNLF